MAAAAVVWAQPQPASWTRLAEAEGKTEGLEAALARTRDGVLHVAFLRGETKSDLMHLAIGADGKAGAEISPVARGWESVSTPMLIARGDGSLEVTFGGLYRAGQSPAGPNRFPLYTGMSPDGGRTWQLSAGALAVTGELAKTHLSAAQDKDGNVATAYASGGKVVLQYGVGAGPGAGDVRDGECCVSRVQVAPDRATGEVVVGWHEDSGPRSGLYLRTMAPKAGPAQRAPDALAANPGQRVAVVARQGASGIYSAYCAGAAACQQVKLWDGKAGSVPVVVGRAVKGGHVVAAPAPEGRLWVMWSDAGAVKAVRSNKALTRFSGAYSAGVEPGKTVYRLVGEGSAGPLDVVANFGAEGAGALHHRRIYPALQVAATVKGVKVTDVGDPVDGVEVESAGQKATTDDNGVAALTLTPGKRVAVKVSHPAYAPASVTLIAGQKGR